jgi:hypothetical protein
MLIDIDIDKNSWIVQIPEEHQQSVVNKYLNLGYIMSTLCQQTVNPMSSLFEPIMNKVSETSNNNELTLNSINSSIRENIGSLRGTIDNFIYQSANSSLKGKIGENQINDILSDHFPDDVIDLTAQKEFESDIHIITPEGIKLYVEVKTYKSLVTTSQIDKFKRDIIRSGVKVGIMISTTSGITGKKRMDYEQVDDEQYIIYVPNSGFNHIPVIWAVLFAKKLVTMTNKKKEIDMGILLDCYRKFESIYKNFSTMKHNLIKTRKTIIGSLDDLHIESLRIEQMIQNVLHECNTYLYNILDEKEEIYLEDKDTLEFLKELDESKDKRHLPYSILYDYCKTNGFNIFYKSNKLNWVIKNNDKDIGETKYTKTKMELCIPDKGITVQLNSSSASILDTIFSN